MYGFGQAAEGQLGVSPSDQKDMLFTPTRLTEVEELDVRHVACGTGHTLILTSAGHVYSMGDNECGQLGRTGIRKKPGSLFVSGLHFATFCSTEAVMLIS